MSKFEAGWWAVDRRDDGSTEAWFFADEKHVTGTALLLSNGDQLLYFRPTKEKPFLLRDWNASYERLGSAPTGDTWDNDKYGARANASMQTPKDFPRASRKPSAQELSGRAGKADLCKADGLDCVRELHVGVFFDGTNNNMVRDRSNVGHSNIVTLYDAHRLDEVEYFKFYLPGVGTPFPEIGEKGEDSKGKSMARGGEARIHYAMIMLYNAVASSVTGTDLVLEDEAKTLVTDIWKGLKTVYRGGNGKMIQVFEDIDKRLLERVKEKRPTIARLHLTVFGFSRGAAEARTFANWVKLATKGKVGPAELNIRFLGLYDTVASVLLADSSPVGSGFLDWANGSMGVPTGIEQTVHYCAGHEIRRSFPLSTLRMGGDWPSPAKEFVYPGVHSDIGGGYAPGDQGKGRAGRADMLSQIPLSDMYFEGVNSGVKLIPLNELSGDINSDFKIEPALQSAFSAYLQWTPTNEQGENVSDSKRGHMEGRMQTQMQHYWRWRGKYTSDADLKTLKSWAAASAQDKADLEEGNKDWQVDLQRARDAHQPQTITVPVGLVGVPIKLSASPSQVQKDVVKAVDAPVTIPADVDRFFDDYVHDSHAGFWMLGPITRIDKAIFVNEIRRRNALRKHHLALAKQYSELRNHDQAGREYMRARSYELNRFEQQVLAANPKDVDIDDENSSANVPLMRDSDAKDLRGNMGAEGWIVKNVVGTGTRREPNGVGQYRHIMDRDHERFLQPVQEVEYQRDRAIDAAKEKVQEGVNGARQKAEEIKDGAVRAVDRAVDNAIDASKDAVKDAVGEGIKRILPSGLPRF
ncbi:DUF2235 domain-containing protein [Stenotrophomonas sp. SY1]|uniref:T6SS phospholipase effector Tle1-like catalytic domain-containing protein n=1 Tax=Stenotrophomonas sp. SY1 TaxID=477235 RepID=UPI001E2D8ED3|nr:DUF2235 domain-containing protein [Stenotrophomonas sp. SY1]MCD9087070.1 DUF2235 domain-containing protein [Stenotrophomonas sp. SY1]